MADESGKHDASGDRVVEAYREMVSGGAGPRFRIDLLQEDESHASASNRRRKDRAEARKAEADAERAEGENELRNMLGKWALRFVGFQILVCDVVVGAYVGSSICRGEAVPSEVIIGWMTSSLVEIIGILWVIARSLFPFKDRGGSRES